MMADIGPEVCRRSVFHSLDLPPVVPGILLHPVVANRVKICLGKPFLLLRTK